MLQIFISSFGEILHIGSIRYQISKEYQLDGNGPMRILYAILIVIIGVCFASASELYAQVYPSNPYQQHKRIKVDDGASLGALNLGQGGDERPSFLIPLAPPVEEKPAKPLPSIRSANWFWHMISPELARAHPERLAIASDLPAIEMASLEPEAETLLKIAFENAQILQEAGETHRVSPAFLLAVIFSESAGQPSALSHAGAQGLMQLMPATAERFDVDNPYDASQSIDGGAAYLNWLLTAFEEDAIFALAGYNAGENAVWEYRAVPPYTETRNYIPKVIAAWRVARTLCETPPITPRDACILSAS